MDYTCLRELKSCSGCSNHLASTYPYSCLTAIDCSYIVTIRIKAVVGFVDIACEYYYLVQFYFRRHRTVETTVLD